MTHLDWKHGVRTIPEHGLELEREAAPNERAAVVADLDLLSCERLRVHYRIARLDRRRFTMTAALDMVATQPCIVTLEPLATKLSHTFHTELWPQEDLPAPPDGVIDAFGEDEPEIFENDVIDVGSIIVNRLADMIDAYPRKPGTVFSWTDEKAGGAEEEGPFFKLKGLHSRR